MKRPDGSVAYGLLEFHVVRIRRHSRRTDHVATLELEVGKRGGSAPWGRIDAELYRGSIPPGGFGYSGPSSLPSHFGLRLRDVRVPSQQVEAEIAAATRNRSFRDSLIELAQWANVAEQFGI